MRPTIILCLGAFFLCLRGSEVRAKKTTKVCDALDQSTPSFLNSCNLGSVKLEDCNSNCCCVILSVPSPSHPFIDTQNQLTMK